MDDKGYAITPLAFLLIIPVVIVAVSYGNIVDELNMVSQIAIGGDVTFSAAESMTSSMQQTAGDAGRHAAYDATKQVLDSETARQADPFLDDSRGIIANEIALSINSNMIQIAKNVSVETGRKVYINNVYIASSMDPDSNSTTQLAYSKDDINIYQTDPYGFYVTVAGGLNITVVQNGQNYTYTTPPVTSYVSIEGLEDPYIWVKTKDRSSYLIYKYPYYSYYATGIDYHFGDSVTSDGMGLNSLSDCLNGTGNVGNITPNPYYFPDTNGMTFFDRLEGKTNSTSTGNASARMSTFIIGEPLLSDYNGAHKSAVDHEYFDGVAGNYITVNGNPLKDPLSHTFYISSRYLTALNLKTKYN